MRQGAGMGKRGRHGLYAFLLAAFSCVLGVSFCLVKSPQARSESYLSLCVQAMAENDDDTAVSAAMEAVRLDPSMDKGWMILSELLQKKGHHQAALRARSIAAVLQKNGKGFPPAYAVPAEFRLSLLAPDDMDAR